MRFAISLFTTLSLTGCLVHPPTGDDDGAAGGGGSTTYPTAGGTYQVTSHIDITIEALLPQPAEDFVVTARDFSTNPAHTLISLADSAGVPAVGTIRDYLPDYVEGKLEGWINDEINKITIAGVPVTQVAGEFAALAETSLTQVSLESELTIGGGSATHRLTVLDLAPTGLDVQLDLGALPGDVVTASTTATSSHGVLTVGNHTFGLAYGEYAWRALEAACTAEYGAGLRETLGTAVNCASIANTVGNKCLLGVCVGHKAELAQICEAGLDEVVDRVHDKLASLKFDAIHFSAGTATISTQALTNGTWTAEINAGQGLRHVPAAFTATR
jgi:hypothetical protein